MANQTSTRPTIARIWRGRTPASLDTTKATLISIARETGGQVVVLMPSVGGEKEITDYFKLFDYDIAKLKKAFDEVH